MQLLVNGSTLFYKKEGTGEVPLLLFHGFGQDNSAFTSLVRSLSSRYTLYIFDLYFHGQSTWRKDDYPLEKYEWAEVIQMFLTEEKIEQFSLLGYSMGAKFVFATIEAMPHRIKEIILIAPDGVKLNPWYTLATYPLLMRKFFKSMVLHPHRFTHIVDTLHKLKLIDERLLRFAEYQMNTLEKRKRVYYAWVVFRHLQFDIKKIAELINRNKISTTILVGKHDTVIKPESVHVLTKRLNKFRLEILEVGHTGLIQKSIPYINLND